MHKNRHNSQKLPYIGISSLCLRCKLTRNHSFLVQVGTLLTYRYLQLCYSTPTLVMYQLNFMWCLMMISPGSHSWGKAQFPKFWQILCSVDHKAVQRIIMTSRIRYSFHIFSNIPEKLQYTIRESLQKITINHSPNRTYKKVRHLNLHFTNVQFPRESIIHQNERNLVSINNHPTLPVGCHPERDKSDLQIKTQD